MIFQISTFGSACSLLSLRRAWRRRDCPFTAHLGDMNPTQLLCPYLVATGSLLCLFILRLEYQAKSKARLTAELHAKPLVSGREGLGGRHCLFFHFFSRFPFPFPVCLHFLSVSQQILVSLFLFFFFLFFPCDFHSCSLCIFIPLWFSPLLYYSR